MEPRQQLVLSTANACPSLRSAWYSAHPSAPSGGTLGQQYLFSGLGTYCAEVGHAFQRPRLVEDVWVLARDLGLCSV